MSGVAPVESLGPETLLAAALIVAFVVIHVFGGRLFSVGVVPRNRILSLAGGVSVSYVFVHVLPEIREAEHRLADGTSMLASVEERVYLVALVGFVLYYGVEQFVRCSEENACEGDVERGGRVAGGSEATVRVFWVHVSAFAAYNALIGYLVFHREAPGIGSTALFGLAMALHFLVNDYGLRDRHREAYQRRGRWLLSLGVVAGGVAGALTSLAPTVLGVGFAFLSGGIILNVIKEELPSERESQFWAFAAGAASYALLLVRV